MHYMINWYYEMIINKNLYKPITRPKGQTCIMGIFTSNAFGDLLRLFAFFLSLMICTKKCYGLFPLPFTWIFRDLSKFIFEPVCVKVFRKYLEQKEKNKIQYLEQIMQMYISSFKCEGEFNNMDDVGLGTFLLKPSETAYK